MIQSKEGGKGRFGPYGGRYVPETLIPALEELEEAYGEATADLAFWKELEDLLRDFVGRPTPLYRARRLESTLGSVSYTHLRAHET